MTDNGANTCNDAVHDERLQPRGDVGGLQRALPMIAPRPGIHRPQEPSEGSGSSTSRAAW